MLLRLLLLLSLSFSFSTLNVVTSFYPMYIMALNITQGATGVNLVNLAAQNVGCLHDYTLTMADMKSLAKADVLIVNGLGMESFVEKVALSYGNLKIIQASNGISVLRDNYSGAPNPHLWLSLKKCIQQVRNIGKELSIIDTPNANIYIKNTNHYVSDLEKLEKKMKSGLSYSRGVKIITFHESFPYFAAEYGLIIAGVIEREPGSTPSPRELKYIIDVVRKSGVKLLFTEPQYPSFAADVIAKQTGASLYTLDPAVTGPLTKNAYIAIMEDNLTVLKKVFNARR